MTLKRTCQKDKARRKITDRIDNYIFKVAQVAESKDVIKAFLGEDTEFNGSLTFAGTVRIDGQFEGKIETGDNLIIGEKAKVKANIIVGTLLVQGALTGDVMASKRIHIATDGKIVGNISSPALNIEDGALLEGGVKMLSSEEASRIKPSPSPAVAPGPAMKQVMPSSTSGSSQKKD